MLEEDDYSSDTSDEDFIPEGETIDDDDDPESGEDEVDEADDDDESHKGKKRKLDVKKKPNKRKKVKPKNPLLDKLQQPEEDIKEEITQPKDDTKEEEKAESLWADFLADVDEKPAAQQPKPKPKSSWASLLDPNKKKPPSSDALSKGTTQTSAKTSTVTKSTASNDAQESSTTKITKVFQFAGEEVRVEEEVAADSLEAKSSKDSQTRSTKGNGSNSGVRKPSGLSSVLSLIDGKKKLSTLEKTKIDWLNFKSSEGLEDELKTHLRSKEGYLEKQAFLERADLRQFEIEKKMRMNRRNNR